MISEIQDHGFSDLSTTRLLSFLNEAYYEVCSEAYPFLEREVQFAAASLYWNLPATITITATAVSGTSTVCTTAAPHGLMQYDTVTIAGALVNTAINGTWQVQSVADPENFTITATSNGSYTANSATLTPAYGVSAVQAVIDRTNGFPLQAVRSEEAWKKFPASVDSTSGGASNYFFIGETLRFFPNVALGTTYRVLYLISPPPLDVTTTLVPLIPTKHHRLIVLLALEKAYTMNDDTDIAAQIRQQYELRLAKAKQDLWMRQYDLPDHIVDVRDDDYYMGVYFG